LEAKVPLVAFLTEIGAIDFPKLSVYATLSLAK